jgi:hypothetical protein
MVPELGWFFGQECPVSEGTTTQPLEENDSGLLEPPTAPDTTPEAPGTEQALNPTMILSLEVSDKASGIQFSQLLAVVLVDGCYSQRSSKSLNHRMKNYWRSVLMVFPNEMY